ncbi:MAG: hypothetical protein Q9159_005666 [Coniocarpon cinnabarinum]
MHDDAHFEFEKLQRSLAQGKENTSPHFRAEESTRREATEQWFTSPAGPEDEVQAIVTIDVHRHWTALDMYDSQLKSLAYAWKVWTDEYFLRSFPSLNAREEPSVLGILSQHECIVRYKIWGTRGNADNHIRTKLNEVVNDMEFAGLEVCVRGEYRPIWIEAHPRTPSTWPRRRRRGLETV